MTSNETRCTIERSRTVDDKSQKECRLSTSSQGRLSQDLPGSSTTCRITDSRLTSDFETEDGAIPKNQNKIKQSTSSVHPKRHIGMLEIASVGWSICNSWIGVLTTFAFVINQGGSPTLLYGLIVVFIMYGCIVCTLAELASAYPSAGGQ